MWAKFKEKYIGDRVFYRHIMYLAIPMIGQNAVSSFVNFLDNIMIGRLGDDPMTGVAVVNQLMFVFQICVFGAVSGASIFGTQFYGKGDYRGQKHCFRYKMYASIMVAMIAIGLFIFCNNPLIKLFLTDTAGKGNIDIILNYGKSYMSIMVVGLVPFAIAQAYVSSIRETGHTLVPMIASAVAVGVNLVLDVILIFGYLGFPKLGVVGAAIATVIARYVEAIIVILWAHLHLEQNKYLKGAYRGLGIPKVIFIDIVKKGIPLMFNEILWAVGMTTIVQCYSVRGTDVMAALSVSNTITNLFNIVYIQLGSCLAIVVGQHLGAGDIKKAKDSVNKIMCFSVLCCIVIGTIMILGGSMFPRIYNVSSDIKELATNFIIISALIMPFCSYAHCSYFTLRSGGKTFITFLFDSAYTWVVIIPCAFLLSRYSTLGIIAVFAIVQSAEILKVIIGYLLIKSGIWVKNIVNDI